MSRGSGPVCRPALNRARPSSTKPVRSRRLRRVLDRLPRSGMPKPIDPSWLRPIRPTRATGSAEAVASPILPATFRDRGRHGEGVSYRLLPDPQVGQSLGGSLDHQPSRTARYEHPTHLDPPRPVVGKAQDAEGRAGQIHGPREEIGAAGISGAVRFRRPAGWGSRRAPSRRGSRRGRGRAGGWSRPDRRRSRARRGSRRRSDRGRRRRRRTGSSRRPRRRRRGAGRRLARRDAAGAVVVDLGRFAAPGRA